LEALVTVAEFALRIPDGVTDADEPRAVGILMDASAEVRAEAGKTWEGVTVPDIIKSVTINVAKRAFLNRDGLSSESDALDNYSHQTTYAHASPAVYLEPEEKRKIRRAAGRIGVWTQSTTRAGSTWETDVPSIIDSGDATLTEEVDPFGEGLPGAL
jgi:hypothetical protein